MYNNKHQHDNGYTQMCTKHIWTYAIGVSLGNSCYTCSCPCNSDRTAQVPPYVGRDYYCETGFNAAGHSQTFFPNDPLWDGQQCVGVEAPCCTHPNMPWFTKTLGETTTEDIQLRLCNDHGIGDEETLLQLIELYVYWHKQFFATCNDYALQFELSFHSIFLSFVPKLMFIMQHYITLIMFYNTVPLVLSHLCITIVMLMLIVVHFYLES